MRDEASRILVVNAGSSSLKLSVLDAADTLLASRSFPGGVGARDLAGWVGAAGRIEAVGHRIVHGGSEFAGPVLMSGEVRARIEALGDLAPLHQARALGALDALAGASSGIPVVACFDTAFHAHMPEAAALYAVPAEWRRRWGIRRFGFHGLSHAYASSRTAELMNRPVAELRVVTCHLGAGASLAAVQGGRSVDTTMGFTPLEGLVMATRSGSVDPGLVLWLIRDAGLDPSAVAAGLEEDSGLVGLAGTADMRAVLERSSAGDAEARLALDVYLHRLRAGIAAMAASMGGIDAITFTGGVGESAAEVRRRAAEGLGFLGLAIDDERNAFPDGDRAIGDAAASVPAFVVKAREDLQIAHEVRALLG
ncbi:MAG: acetate/propionate family kinase [Actinobacteria bacterium]|nr:MAG: acetate/propionate family kinase [Actinomycetota bacterium]